jgi:hypothetical protein
MQVNESLLFYGYLSYLQFSYADRVAPQTFHRNHRVIMKCKQFRGVYQKTTNVTTL